MSWARYATPTSYNCNFITKPSNHLTRLTLFHFKRNSWLEVEIIFMLFCFMNFEHKTAFTSERLRLLHRQISNSKSWVHILSLSQEFARNCFLLHSTLCMSMKIRRVLITRTLEPSNWFINEKRLDWLTGANLKLTRSRNLFLTAK